MTKEHCIICMLPSLQHHYCDPFEVMKRAAIQTWSHNQKGTVDQEMWLNINWLDQGPFSSVAFTNDEYQVIWQSFTLIIFTSNLCFRMLYMSSQCIMCYTFPSGKKNIVYTKITLFVKRSPYVCTIRISNNILTHTLDWHLHTKFLCEAVII